VKAWWLAVLWLLWPALASAHPQSPITAQVAELEDHAVAVTLRRAAALHDTVRMDPPAGCRVTAATSRREGGDRVDTSTWQCDGPLVGRTLALPGLRAQAVGALLIVTPHGVAPLHTVLGPDAVQFVVPPTPGSGEVVAQYVQLGARHLLSGADHLLFVLALVLLAGSFRRLVVTVTAFTLGHSVTLAAAALGWIALPSAWAEIGIALTLVVVALQTLEADAQRSRHGPGLALAFGLVHGLGFSGALAEVGLPTDARVPALFGFNAGLELAQLAVVLLAWPLWRSLARTDARRRLGHAAVGYAIGALACMWTLERLLL
jgi:hypothetical protein